MEPIDPRLRAALEEQLAAWRRTLRNGAERVGWKLGVGERESIGGEIAVGHLTSATRLAPGATYVASDAAADLHADVELAVELGRDVDPAGDPAAALAAIAGYGVALEIVDLAGLPGEPETVVAANVFHRAVAFGPLLAKLPGDEVVGRLSASGATRAAARAANDLVERISAAARLLGAVGEGLEAGDLVITGSIAQMRVGAGDEVFAAVPGLGEVRLSIAG